MSMLIKGIEMPKEGQVIVIDSTGQVWSNEWPTRGYTRINNAKAVPVPPHGRLTDANVVERDLQEMSEDIEHSFPYLDKNDVLMIERGVQFARKYVLNLSPTIIEADEGEEE